MAYDHISVNGKRYDSGETEYALGFALENVSSCEDYFVDVILYKPKSRFNLFQAWDVYVAFPEGFDPSNPDLETLKEKWKESGISDLEEKIGIVKGLYGNNANYE